MWVHGGLAVETCAQSVRMGCLGGLVPSACLVVPMDCASVHAHKIIMGTCRDMHTWLGHCLLWAHASGMGMCHGHMWAITWPCWTVKWACWTPLWLFATGVLCELIV